MTESFYLNFVERVRNAIMTIQGNQCSYKLIRKIMGIESSDRSSIIFLARALDTLQAEGLIRPAERQPGNVKHKYLIINRPLEET